MIDHITTPKECKSYAGRCTPGCSHADILVEDELIVSSALRAPAGRAHAGQILSGGAYAGLPHPPGERAHAGRDRFGGAHAGRPASPAYFTRDKETMDELYDATDQC